MGSQTAVVAGPLRLIARFRLLVPFTKDVRFVIHYSMPKSITHYYQESGRAGRDGEKADCILYYSYKDKQVLEGMIRKSAADPYGQSTRRKIDQLYTCLRYCEDDFECRRTMQLQFFGESFCKSKCKETCDNCRAGREVEKVDMTEAAKALLDLLSSVQSQRKNGAAVTLLQLTELFRGSKAKSVTKYSDVSRLKGYGAASQYSLRKKQDIDRIARAMVFERIIMESSEQNKQGYSSDYVQPGENAISIRNGQKRFHVDFPKARQHENAAKKPTPKKKAARKRESRATDKKSPEVYSLFDEDEDDGNADDCAEDPAGQVKAIDPVMSTSVLPPDVTLKLKKRIRKVVGMWADEEQMMGNTVYCELNAFTLPCCVW
jgi:superfamily II DNA helicase RecQ